MSSTFAFTVPSLSLKYNQSPQQQANNHWARTNLRSPSLCLLYLGVAYHSDRVANQGNCILFMTIR
ncbi:hypothetical protein ACN23B_07245 [Anabaena sp. FACHB-709]|uniref:Uncharacterized protein n=1 Tax=Anabaena cylindrica FACHB-318 TaxID=2692880 RepID=A0ABR7ZFB0_ANACY|nr:MULTISPECIES: hypothetical protein [Nostocaceae]MBD2170811.1 hypothetical protein [Anabaena cylindrica FACHB-318]MBD2282935.1 hypothetical protein [Anabaena cylindrica FACHB-170]